MLATPSSGAAGGPSDDGGPARILIADDNLEMAQSVAEGLRERGYVATAVGSGREALDHLHRDPFDALITDLRMPEIDGLTLIASSRRLDPNRPVIAMTAFSAIDIALESLRQGAYHYLTKPFKTEELAIFLARALNEVRLKQAVRELGAAFRRYEAAAALRESDGQLGRAAEKLGVDAVTLKRWLDGTT
jgi:two-component system response regulator HydG